MPEIKRTFSGGKMNKDIDERLVPPNEYRDANNIEINTSEGSNVGTVQTLKGNTKLDAIFTDSDAYSCVGSIADHKNDKIYWLVAGPNSGEVESITTGSGTSNGYQAYKDYIIEYDIALAQYRYIVIDIHKIVTKECTGTHGTPGVSVDHLHIPDLGNATVNITGIRIGMRITGTFENNSGVTITAPNGDSVAHGDTYTVIEKDDVTVTDIQKDTGSPSDWRVYFSKELNVKQDDEITFTSDRVLNFNKDRLITGINIMDGMLFWTDNHSEPKKINIERCALGTGGVEYLKGGGIDGYASGSPTSDVFYQIDPTYGYATSDRVDYFHTRLVSSVDGFNLKVVTNLSGNKAAWLEEEHVTVLRKAPVTPPYLEMSITEKSRQNSSGVANNVSTIVDFAFSTVNPVTGDSELLSPGDGPFEIFFDDDVDFRVGDILILSSDENANQDTFVEHEVRIRITGVPSGHNPPNTILSGVAGDAFEYVLLSINPYTPTAITTWRCRLEKSKPMFENKFVRFAYRHKYKDGEYSSISPWSEIAFKPGEFDYAPVQAYNLGMSNQLRNLKITDYVVEDDTRGRDVIEVDILYKEEGSPNIYTVETIKIADEHPRWPGTDYARGIYEIESELIHAVLPEDQLIRPWDAVPRKALAQEIIANRLAYGNYLQNYNIQKDGVEILPKVKASLVSTLSDLAKHNDEIQVFDPIPSADAFKSVKSLRTYQLGVVYRDKYGRETPVLTGGNESTVKIEKDEAYKINKILASIPSEAPDWAESWKFFVKETSNEYYNMSMDRWYNAEDGNVWLSFPSAERNKVDEETFLVLKKQHENDTPVNDLARYKVIAISNEAPTYIKLNQKLLGKADPLNYPTFSQIVSTTTAGFPFEGYTEFDVRTQQFFDSISAGVTGGAFEENVQQAMYAGQLYLRFTVAGVTSKYYNIASVKPSFNTTSYTTIKVDGILGVDVEYLAPGQTTSDIIANIAIEVVTRIPENKPEFDGRFFVKVYKDLVLEENILQKSLEQTYEVIYAMTSNYLAIGSLGNNASAGTFPNNFVLNDIGGVSSTGSCSWHIRPQGYSNSGIQALSNGTFSQNTGRRRRSWKGWWRAWSQVSGWFIDSAITANEDQRPGGPHQAANFDAGEWNLGTWSNSVAQTNITDQQHGIFDAAISSFINPTGTTGPGTAILLSYAGVWRDGFRGSTNNTPNGVVSNLGFNGYESSQAETITMLAPGRQFRFRDDPDQIVYTIRSATRLPIRHNYDAAQGGTGAWDHFEDGANKRFSVELIVSDSDGFGIGNAEGNGISYHPYDQSNANGADWGTAYDHDSRGVIEFVQPFNPFDDKPSSTNPAIWETEPKEDVGLDIYYEASQAYPMTINPDTNEQYAKIGSIVQLETGSGPFTSTIKVTSWSGQTATLSPDTDVDVVIGDIISFTSPDGGVTRLVAKKDVASGSNSLTFYGSAADADTDPDYMPHKQLFTLPFSNCYSFGNGVESNRIRDDFNTQYIRNGVKASTVLAKHYEEERKATGMIHSGIYNSVSGINETNQFIAGKKITKDLNPRHGSIQVMKSRNTNMVVVTEDKCFNILADKDALFNADGNAQLLSKKSVFGQSTPYQGDYGTKHPESFVIDNFRSYFVDAVRGQVCRLSMDGVTPISSQGMHDWFADNLKPGTVDSVKTEIKKIIGTFDDRKNLYNVSITQDLTTLKNPNNPKGYPTSEEDKVYTVSYSENTKGWVTFKDLDLENGLSINNDFYTFKHGNLWKEYSNDTRLNFYGVQKEASLTAIFNDEPGSIKTFNSINYEGTQAKVDVNVGADGEYYNLKSYTGWYVDSDGFETNEQTAEVPEFIEKEGKWFNYLRGQTTLHNNDSSDLSVTSSNLDQQEFSVQGIGVASNVTGGGETRQWKFIVANNTSTTYNPDTEIDSNTDGSPDGVWDSTAD